MSRGVETRGTMFNPGFSCYWRQKWNKVVLASIATKITSEDQRVNTSKVGDLVDPFHRQIQSRQIQIHAKDGNGSLRQTRPIQGVMYVIDEETFHFWNCKWYDSAFTPPPL